MLQSETPYPFLQEYIQKFGAPELEATLGNEEEALKSAYEFTREQVDRVLESVDVDTSVSQDKKAEVKKRRLTSIRDKLLRLQLILIQLNSEDEAYIIFETLNTRGKDLAVSDLVKNHLTRLMKPKNRGVDVARQKWQDILEHFEEASTDIDVNSFLHHAWLSREPYLPQKKMFKQIKKVVTKPTAPAFLDNLHSDSRLYRRVVDPDSHKWKRDQRPLAASLRAINLFRVVQPVPMLLSVMRAYEDDRLALKQIRQLLRSLESFHFQFSAVTAQRTGGGTGLMFALGARELEATKTKNQADKVLKGFTEKLRERLPSYAAFEAGFAEIHYTEDNSKQRQLVRYLWAGLMNTCEKMPRLTTTR